MQDETAERELDELYPFTREGVDRLTEDSEDHLDDWFAKRGQETSRARWKRRATELETRLAERDATIAALSAPAGRIRRIAKEDERDRLLDAILRRRDAAEPGSTTWAVLEAIADEMRTAGALGASARAEARSAMSGMDAVPSRSMVSEPA